MEKRAAIFLATGAVLAVLTGVALYGLAQQSTGQPAAPQGAVVELVVARIDIAPRTRLTQDMLARRAYPTELVPEGAVTGEAEAVGQVTRAVIRQGQAILRSDLAASGGPGTAAPIAPGKVLVAFPTSDAVTAAGVIHVGDRVDVLATLRSGSSEGGIATQTTLQNLDVVDIVEPPKDQPQRPTVLMFVVDHQSALVLKYLRDSQAVIDLVVHSADETGVSSTTTVDQGYLTTTFRFRR